MCSRLMVAQGWKSSKAPCFDYCTIQSVLYNCKHWLLARHLDAHIVPSRLQHVHIGKFIEVHDARQYIRARTAGCNINFGTVNIVMHR